MRVRIHRGAQEIGGNCIEIEARGSRLVLDLGRPLDAGRDEVPLPAISGLADGADGSLLGVVISHPHQDHYGLLPQIAASVPVFIGESAQRLVNEAAWFIGAKQAIRAREHLRHRRPLSLGPFRITPFLNDHSAYDAYSLLIEAGGRRLFYTGDIRGSGRKAGMFEALCTRPPREVHSLLMEGTHVRPAGPASQGLTERGVEEELLSLCRRTHGAVFVAYSGQNIDRLVSIHRAALRAGRELVVDLYGATMGQATGNPRIPQPGHRGLRVLVPQRQRVKIRKEGCFERVNSLGRSRVYADELKASPSKFIITLRANVLPDLEGCRSSRAESRDPFSDAHAVWSMWDGYLEQHNSQRVRDFAARHEVPLTSIHASGHATVPELQRLVASLAPERVVPIHSSATGRFAEFFPRVVNHPDGEWWTV